MCSMETVVDLVIWAVWLNKIEMPYLLETGLLEAPPSHASNGRVTQEWVRNPKFWPVRQKQKDQNRIKLQPWISHLGQVLGSSMWEFTWRQFLHSFSAAWNNILSSGYPFSFQLIEQVIIQGGEMKWNLCSWSQRFSDLQFILLLRSSDYFERKNLKSSVNVFEIEPLLPLCQKIFENGGVSIQREYYAAIKRNRAAKHGWLVRPAGEDLLFAFIRMKF